MPRGPQSSIKVDQTKRRRQIAKDLLLWTSAKERTTPSGEKRKRDEKCSADNRHVNSNSMIQWKLPTSLRSTTVGGAFRRGPRYVQYRQSRPDANSLVDTATKKSDDGQTTCSTETFAIRFDSILGIFSFRGSNVHGTVLDLPVNNQHAIPRYTY